MKADRINKLSSALAKNEMFEFLIGNKEYSIANPYADTPTHPHEVLNAFVEYFETTQDINLWQQFKHNIILLSQNPKLGWLALYYLVGYFRLEQRLKYRFIDSTDLYNIVTTNLDSNKAYFLNNKNWCGKDYPNGLWGDIERMTQNIKSEFGKSKSL